MIRALIHSGRIATVADLDQIVTRMAQAEYPTIKQHLNKRVGEKQWVDGTTEGEYLADLRNAIRNGGARLAIYERRGGNIASVVAETANIIPDSRRGQDSLPLLFVAYSADRGIIVSGYQASILGEISIPKRARWLK